MSFVQAVTSEELAAVRRELHRHAESGFSEFWTTAFLAQRLSAAGCAVRVGEDVIAREARFGVPAPHVQEARLAAARAQGADAAWLERMGGLTGLIVDIRPDLPLLTALRFDIDAVDVALPVRISILSTKGTVMPAGMTAMPLSALVRRWS